MVLFGSKFMRIFDYTDPANLVIVSNFVVRENEKQGTDTDHGVLDVNQTLVYIANGAYGPHIVDITDLTKPFVCGKFDITVKYPGGSLESIEINRD